MSVNKAWQDYATTCIDHLAIGIDKGLNLPSRSDLLNPLIAHNHRAVLDD